MALAAAVTGEEHATAWARGSSSSCARVRQLDLKEDWVGFSLSFSRWIGGDRSWVLQDSGYPREEDDVPFV
jgi:hypothetical protein